MNYLTWQNIYKDTAKYIELFVLPNTIAFALSRLFYYDIEITDSYKVFYNTIKNLFNVINEDEELIFNIAKQILYVKYGLKFEVIDPIKLKKIRYL